MKLLIGENIKRLRAEKGITQEAQYMHVSAAAVSKWEKNESMPDITMVIPLASYFGVRRAIFIVTIYIFVFYDIM